MKVSVVIPTHNLAGLVKEAIQSVLDQTYQDFEIIVVDDGSTDDTRAVIATIGDPRLQYIYQENRGLAGARNTGIALARGEYIAFLDADDVFLPNKLMDQTSVLDSQPDLGLVAGGYVFTDEAGQPVAEQRHWQDSPQLDVKTWLYGCPFIVNAVLVRREWLSRVGGFDPALRRVEDRDLWLRLAYHGCRMAWSPDIVCVYRMREGQMVRDGRSQKENTLAVLEKFFAQPDLPASLRQEHGRARASVHLEGACREYAAGQIKDACQDLAQAIAGMPDLAANNMQRLVDVLMYWAVDPLTGDPTEYLTRVLDNLPDSASRLRGLRDRLLYTAAIWAAASANMVGNRSLARQHLIHALERGSLLAAQPTLAVELLVDCARNQELERQVETIESFFGNLPSELASLRPYYRKALGRLYLARGFEAQNAGAYPEAARAMWQGVRLDPTWLRNRGVRSILFRSLLGSAIEKISPPPRRHAEATIDAQG